MRPPPLEFRCVAQMMRHKEVATSSCRHKSSEPGVLFYRPERSPTSSFFVMFSSGSEQAVAFPKHTPHAFGFVETFTNAAAGRL